MGEKSQDTVNNNNNNADNINADKNIDVFETKNISKLPRWVTILVAIALIVIGICAVAFLFNTGKENALYGQDCDVKPCASKFNLQCTNGKCDCANDNFYSKGCQLRKTYSERCSNNSNDCILNLSCLNGVCSCYITSYWTGEECLPKGTYKDSCQNPSSIECLTTSMLYCHIESKKCLCKNNRLGLKSITYLKIFNSFDNIIAFGMDLDAGYCAL